MICPKCGLEYVDGITQCSDCKVPLITIDEFKMAQRIVVARAPKALANRLVAFLEYNNIKNVEQKADGMQNMDVIIVDAEDADEAIRYARILLQEEGGKYAKEYGVEEEDDEDDDYLPYRDAKEEEAEENPFGRNIRDAFANASTSAMSTIGPKQDEDEEEYVTIHLPGFESDAEPEPSAEESDSPKDNGNTQASRKEEAEEEDQKDGKASLIIPEDTGGSLHYTSKMHTYKEVRSSAFSFLAVGAIALIVEVLILTGVIRFGTLTLSSAGMIKFMLGMMGIIFLVVAVLSALRAKKLKPEAEEEEARTERWLERFYEAYSPEQVDRLAKVAGNPEAVVAFARTDTIRGLLIAQNKDEDAVVSRVYINHLTETIYNEYYEDQEDTEE